MAYRRYGRGRRSNRRSRNYVDWSEHHRKERAAVATKYGGIDEDIRNIFFSLDERSLDRVFTDYTDEYGKRKCDYARRTYSKWRTGEVEMSGEVSERLLDILPHYLNFEDKYTLIEKMWRNRNRRTLRILVAPSEGVAVAVQKMLQVIDSLDIDVLPESLKNRMSWLAESDAAVAEQLLLRLYAEERRIIIRTLQHEMRRVATLIIQARKSHVQSIHEFAVPGASIEIIVEEPPRRSKLGSFFMGNQDDSKKNEPQQSGQLVPKKPKEGNDLTSIKDAESLLNNALQHVSPEKKQEIIDKAADEALRLQTKRAHNEIDRETADRMLDTAGRVARQVEATPNANIRYSDEIDKEHGTTRVEVKSQEGFCFVATACFGDYQHPTVKTLRQFRDRALLTSRIGAAFVSFYYRYGRAMAAVVNHLPPLKPVARSLLALLARLYKIRWREQ